MAALRVADADIIFCSCSFYLLLLCFSSPIVTGRTLDVYTWRGLSANLECMSEMCCTLLAENTGCKNYAKNRRMGTIVQSCRAIYSQLRHVSTIGKQPVKQQYLLHMCSQYGEFRPTNGWDLLGSLGHGCSTEVNQTLHDVWLSLGLIHYIYIFGGSCPLTEFYQLQNSLCVQVLRSPILTALLHVRHSSSGRQPKFASWKKEWNSQTVPLIFGRAAITLGIGPHLVNQ